MAFFGVTREIIGHISPIPDADKIVVASLKGMAFQFIVLKDAFKEGDECLYLPVDSLVPEELLEKIGLSGRLSGKQKNRVKTVRMRGQISQGLVIGTEYVPEGMTDPEELTQHLGITKYEPPVLFGKDSKLVSLPDTLSMYDIEGADRYTHIAESLMDEEVLITEKMEGSNFSVSISKDGEVSVNQRRYSVLPLEGKPNLFWTVAEGMGLIEYAKDLYERKGKVPVAVYGEILGPGIQGNIYGFKRNIVKVFDIKVGLDWMDASEWAKEMFTASVFWAKAPIGKEVCAERLAETGNAIGGNPMYDVCVPILNGDLNETLREWVNKHGGSIQEASNGKSWYGDTLREGIVIRPKTERRDPKFGRIIIKQRSPEYLAKSDY